MLYLMGIFADGEQVNLSESSYLKFSSDNPRVARVTERGTVVATGTGSARIYDLVSAANPSWFR